MKIRENVLSLYDVKITAGYILRNTSLRNYFQGLIVSSFLGSNVLVRIL
jgi:hypothetical protein